jgi:hypothetical protein
MRSVAQVRHELPVTCNAAVTCNGPHSGAAELDGLRCDGKDLGRLILLRAERVADEVVNVTLDRGVALWIAA